MTNEFDNWEIIFQAGTEGGGVALYGNFNGKYWEFGTTMNDQTPVLIDDESIHKESGVFNEFSEAMEIIDRYQWHLFTPLEVHPAFRGTILAEVVVRLQEDKDLTNSNLDRWLQLCGQVPNKLRHLSLLAQR